MSGDERGAAVSIPGALIGERSAAASVIVDAGGATEQRTVIQAYELDGKDAVGGTMTQTQEVPELDLEPKLLPVPKRSAAAPAAAPSVAGAIAGSAVVKAAKGSANMRRSIVALERTWENRMCGVLLYLVVSGLVALFTSLDFFTLIGVVPNFPNIDAVSEAGDRYINFIDNASEVLAKELYDVYNRSVIYQAEDCFERESLSASEALRLRNDTQTFIDNYCKDLGLRIFNYSISTFGDPYVTAIPRCTIVNKFASGTEAQINARNLVWLTNSTILSCGSTNQVGDNCFWQLYFATQNPNCTDDFDQRYDSRYYYPNDGASEVCNEYREVTMQEAFRDFDDEQYSTFWEALQNLMTYNENYLAKMLPSIDLLGDLNLKLDVKMRALELKFQDFNANLNLQIDYMFKARSILLKLRGVLPGVTVPNVDLSAPSIPDFDLIDLNIGEIDLTLDLFNDYNPPPIVGVSVNLSEYSIPEYKPEFTSNFSLASSNLYQDVLSLGDTIKAFIKNFAQLDLIIRFINWLREFGFLIRVVKRDMTTLKAKIKRYLALLLQNAIVVLYIGIFIYASSAFLKFDGFNFDFALAEMNVQCENTVYIKNLDKLAKYQAELFLKRSECNSALSARNNLTTSINDGLITPVIDLAQRYEGIYHADNEGITVSPKDYAVNVVDFQLPVVDLGDGLYGQIVDEQGVSEIESYTVRSDDCDNSEDAKRLTEQLNLTTTEIKYYLSGVFLITISLILTSRLTSMGLQYFFWMELTRGYAFDTPFTSDTVRARIKARKRNAVIMWIFALGFVIFASAYGRDYLRKKIPSAYN